MIPPGTTNIQFALKPSWLGWVLVVATTQGIVALHLGDTDTNLNALIPKYWPNAKLGQGNSVFQNWLGQIMAFIDRPQQQLNLPLGLEGTAFQQQVWSVLQSIPPGKTTSYKEVAQQMGIPTAVRAVARACATNPVAIVVPCHRVVGSDGALKGYRWGSDRKRALLDREAAYNLEPSVDTE